MLPFPQAALRWGSSAPNLSRGPVMGLEGQAVARLMEISALLSWSWPESQASPLDLGPHPSQAL